MKMLQDPAQAHNSLAKGMAIASMAPGSVTVSKTALMVPMSIDEYVVREQLDLLFIIQLHLFLSNAGPHLRDSMLSLYNNARAREA